MLARSLLLIVSCEAAITKVTQKSYNTYEIVSSAGNDGITLVDSDGEPIASTRVGNTFTVTNSMHYNNVNAALQDGTSFSVASYGRGDSIAPHDDKAHVEVEPEGGGRPVLHSRKYAGIYYLSRGRKAKYGGALVDLEGRGESATSHAVARVGIPTTLQFFILHRTSANFF